MTTLPSAQTDQPLVERELIRQLAICELGAARISFFGYGLLALLLRDLVAPRMLFLWAGLVLLLEVVNGFLAGRLLRLIDEPARRKNVLTILPGTLFLSGLAWGLVVLLPGLERSPWLHALSLLILAVVALFGAGNLGARRACLIGFSTGLVLPLLYASFAHPGDMGVELGVTALAVLAIAQTHGERTRKLILRDVRGQAAMEGLNSQLRRSNEERTLAMEQLHQVAACDPLTQCLNRRAFLERLDYELARRTRYGTSFGVILLDLDGFKSVNDRHGHDVGDRVLVAVADCLRSQLRPIDSLARWGGEAFLCLVAHVREDDLLAKAEDLRDTLAHSPMVFSPEEISITASLGAAISQSDRSALELIAMADRAMYRAKDNGRNRVLLAA